MHIHETGLIALLGALSFGIVVSDGCGVLREHDVDSAGAVVVGQESDPTGEDVDAVAIFAAPGCVVAACTMDKLGRKTSQCLGFGDDSPSPLRSWR